MESVALVARHSTRRRPDPQTARAEQGNKGPRQQGSDVARASKASKARQGRARQGTTRRSPVQLMRRMRNSPIPSTVDSICQHTCRQYLSTPVDSIGEPPRATSRHEASLTLIPLRRLAVCAQSSTHKQQSSTQAFQVSQEAGPLRHARR
jgi:hypothetical protein